MWRIFVATAVCLACSSLRAQAPNEKETPDKVRRRIEELQSQLRKLEANHQGDQRVAEIGTRFQSREMGVVVRLYDLSDLFAVAPSYDAKLFDDFHLGLGAQPMFPAPPEASGPSSSNLRGMGGGMFGVEPENAPTSPAADKRAANIAIDGPSALNAQVAGNEQKTPNKSSGPGTSIDDLIQAITSTIAPTNWDAVGGPSSIARIGNALLISTDLQTHDQIESLLSLFRQRWKTLRTVTVRAYWLWLTDKQVEALVPEPSDDKTPYGLVDDKAWRDRPAADAKFGPGYRAMLTCYNGQTVNTVAGSERLVVSAVDIQKIAPATKEPAAKDDRADVLYRPRVIALQDGVGLQVRPVVNTSGKFIVLDIHGRVTIVNPAASQPKARDAAGAGTLRDVVAAIDRPRVVSTRMSTTLRLPVNRMMLVGGMTFDSDAPGSDTGLYLFVRATVQELTDAAEAAPAAPPEKRD